jgi:hypothetical protein
MSSGIHQRYKRSQVEQAIVALEACRGTAEAVLRANVKRLLDFDRNPEARIFHRASDNTAFFDGPPPGQGAEIAYRPYQAFALLIGVRLLKSGMPQSRVVLFLRDTRVELEPAFERLAGVDAAKLRPDLSEEERSQRIRDGELVEDAAEMTFLIAQAGADPSGAPRPDEWESVGEAACSAAALMERLATFSRHGQAAIVLELTNAVHQLIDTLPRTTVRKRGRQ